MISSFTKAKTCDKRGRKSKRRERKKNVEKRKENTIDQCVIEDDGENY